MAIERRRSTLPEIRESGEYGHSLDVLRRSYPIAPEKTIRTTLDTAYENILREATFMNHIHIFAQSDADESLRQTYKDQPQVR